MPGQKTKILRTLKLVLNPLLLHRRLKQKTLKRQKEKKEAAQAQEKDENEKNDGFGWVSGTVEKMKVPLDFKIPHMGWNTIQFKNNDLFKDIDENSDFYFVHSYEFKTVDENILATTNYASKVTAAIKKDNIFGTQFHPEKSHKNGQKLIKNFILMLKKH